MRFVADAMLGTLVRWLRLIGVDTAYDPHADDRAIARLAVREGRAVLTRDHGLLARRLVRDGLLVASDDLGEQLRQVIAAYALPVDPARLFTRCTACNTPVERVPPEEVQGLVPPYVWRTHQEFRRCPGCMRIYWAGTHEKHAREHLAVLLGGRDDRKTGPVGGSDGT